MWEDNHLKSLLLWIFSSTVLLLVLICVFVIASLLLRMMNQLSCLNPVQNEASGEFPATIHLPPLIWSQVCPRTGLCLSNQSSCTPLGLPEPVCCHRSLIGQNGLIQLLLQLDGICNYRCPPGVSGIANRQAPTTLQLQHQSATSTMEAWNIVHLDSISPISPGTWLKLDWRWKL